jgi:hypothetical protein
MNNYAIGLISLFISGVTVGAVMIIFIFMMAGII